MMVGGQGLCQKTSNKEKVVKLILSKTITVIIPMNEFWFISLISLVSISLRIRSLIDFGYYFPGLRLSESCDTSTTMVIKTTQRPTSVNDYVVARVAIKTIRQFFTDTSLHGLKYLVQKGRSLFEKSVKV